jgi:hypothetical protein
MCCCCLVRHISMIPLLNCCCIGPFRFRKRDFTRRSLYASLYSSVAAPPHVLSPVLYYNSIKQKLRLSPMSSFFTSFRYTSLSPEGMNGEKKMISLAQPTFPSQPSALIHLCIHTRHVSLLSSPFPCSCRSPLKSK